MFVIQILLALLIIFFECCRRRKLGIDLLSVVNLIYFVCFVVAPIAGYYMINDPNVSYYSIAKKSAKDCYRTGQFYNAGILSLLSYMAFASGFLFFRPRRKYKAIDAIFSERLLNADGVFRLALGFFFISFTAFCFLVLHYGSISAYFYSGEGLYFSTDQDDVDKVSGPLQMLVGLCVFSSYLLWGLSKVERKDLLSAEVYGKWKKKQALIRILFLIAFSLSLVHTLRGATRFLLFLYVAAFPIANIYYRQRIRVVRLILIATFGFMVVTYGNVLFLSFTYNDFIKSELSESTFNPIYTFYSFIDNFTFPFYSVANNLKFDGQNDRLFIDFLLAPLYLLPRSIFHLNLPLRGSTVNTLRIWGPDVGEVPSDIVSYGIINAGIIGVVLVAFLFGFVIKIFNSYAAKIRTPISAILFSAFLFIVGFRIMYFDPIHLLRGSLGFIVGLILVANCNRIKLTKKTGQFFLNNSSTAVGNEG